MASRGAARRLDPVEVFAALGDRTRLELVTRLTDGVPQSISELTGGMELSRQAITKHLRVLEKAGIVYSIHQGRETRFELDPGPIRDLKAYLSIVSQLWDEALHRLQTHLGESPEVPRDIRGLGDDRRR